MERDRETNNVITPSHEDIQDAHNTRSNSVLSSSSCQVKDIHNAHTSPPTSITSLSSCQREDVHDHHTTRSYSLLSFESEGTLLYPEKKKRNIYLFTTPAGLSSGTRGGGKWLHFHQIFKHWGIMIGHGQDDPDALMLELDKGHRTPKRSWTGFDAPRIWILVRTRAQRAADERGLRNKHITDTGLTTAWDDDKIATTVKTIEKASELFSALRYDLRSSNCQIWTQVLITEIQHEDQFFDLPTLDTFFRRVWSWMWRPVPRGRDMNIFVRVFVDYHSHNRWLWLVLIRITEAYVARQASQPVDPALVENLDGWIDEWGSMSISQLKEEVVLSGALFVLDRNRVFEGSRRRDVKYGARHAVFTLRFLGLVYDN